MWENPLRTKDQNVLSEGEVEKMNPLRMIRNNRGDPSEGLRGWCTCKKKDKGHHRTLIDGDVNCQT